MPVRVSRHGAADLHACANQRARNAVDSPVELDAIVDVDLRLGPHPDRSWTADVVVVDLDDLNQTPYYNIYSDLVYATKAADVRTVIVEGRVIMRDRRLLTLNEETIKADARRFRERIINSLGAKALPEE